MNILSEATLDYIEGVVDTLTARRMDESEDAFYDGREARVARAALVALVEETGLRGSHLLGRLYHLVARGPVYTRDYIERWDRAANRHLMDVWELPAFQLRSVFDGLEVRLLPFRTQFLQAVAPGSDPPGPEADADHPSRPASADLVARVVELSLKVAGSANAASRELFGKAADDLTHGEALETIAELEGRDRVGRERAA